VSAADAPSLLEVVEAQRLGCELAGSPLSAAVLAHVGAELHRGGPLREVLAPVEGRPIGEAVMLRLLAGLHLLVLDGRAPELAEHYPSVGGAPGARSALAAAIDAAVDRHVGELTEAMTVGVQTNEPGRSATLIGGLVEAARLGRPLEVLEVGASAGLNLRFDRYRYEGRHGALGPADSPLRFARPWLGAEPTLPDRLDVAVRAGCDLSPLDPASAADRLRLRSYVWADQLDRLARLDAALEVARALPVAVDQADAVTWLGDRLARRTPGCTTVVVHSIVLQYLPPLDRHRLLRTVEEAGARATANAPLAWLRMEPGGDQAELRLTTWPGGAARLLATSAYHGPPVAWRGGS
jgi:hypothetical protein